MNLFYKIYPFSIFPLFAFPLFEEHITMKFFILFASLTIVNFLFNKENKENFKNYFFHFIPFIIILVSSIIHFSLSQNLIELNRASLFLIMPIVFYLSPSFLFTKEKINQYLFFMCCISLILIISYITLFLYENPLYDLFRSRFNSSFLREFVYEKNKYFTIHPSYFSIVLIFLTAFSLEQLKKSFHIIYLIFIAFYYVFIFLLLAKLNIILMNLLLLFSILFYFKRKILYKIIIVIIFFFIGFYFIQKTPGLLLRIHEVVNNFNIKPEGVAYDSTNVRKAIYNCDFILIKNNFLFGIGFNDIKYALQNCFNNNYDSNFYKDHLYLTHNYFIYILLGSGIFGFIFFLFYFLRILIEIFKLRSFKYIIFIISVFFMLNIEDYFYRQNGLFYFLLIILSLQKLKINSINK